MDWLLDPEHRAFNVIASHRKDINGNINHEVYHLNLIKVGHMFIGLS